MTDDVVQPLDTGDGTTDSIVVGVAHATEELIAATNQLATAVESILERLEAVEAEEQKAERVDLVIWVEWLRTAYRLHAHIPEDWESVAGMRQELHALHASWFAAYNANGTPKTSHLATAWHDSLDRVLSRFPAQLARDEKHAGVEPPPWVTPPPWEKKPSTVN